MNNPYWIYYSVTLWDITLSFMVASGDFSPVSSRAHGGKVCRVDLDLLMVSRHLPCGAGDTGLGGKEGLGAGLGLGSRLVQVRSPIDA